MTDHGSNPRLKRVREMKRIATDVAKGLLREKAQSLLAGKGSRDIFSLLGRFYFTFFISVYSSSHSEGQHGQRSEKQADRGGVIVSNAVCMIVSSSAILCLMMNK